MNEMKTLTIDGKSYEVVDAEARSMIENVAGLSMELVWENASPTSAFAAQTLTFQGEYDFYAIIVAWNTVVGARKFTGILKAGEPSIISFVQQDVNVREISESTVNSITFGDGADVAFATQAYTTDNTLMIPREIYGIKGVSE